MSMRKLDYDWMADKRWWHWSEAGDPVLNMLRKTQKEAMSIIWNNAKELRTISVQVSVWNN